MRSSTGTALSAWRGVLWRRLLKKRIFARFARVLESLLGKSCSEECALPSLTILSRSSMSMMASGQGTVDAQRRKPRNQLKHDESNEM